MASGLAATRGSAWFAGSDLSTLGRVLFTVLSVNVVLAVFNLIPIPLLDGSRILGGLVPSLGRSLAQFEAMPFSFVLVMGFIYLASEPIGRVIGSVQNWVFQFILSLPRPEEKPRPVRGFFRPA